MVDIPTTVQIVVVIQVEFGGKGDYMKFLKLALRTVGWAVFITSFIFVANGLIHMFEISNWKNGIVYLILCIVPGVIALWFLRLRKTYKTVEEVKYDFPRVSTVPKNVVKLVLVLQVIFTVLCIILTYSPVDKLSSKYEDAETFLVEQFGAQTSTLEVMKLMPVQLAEKNYASAQFMSDAIEMAESITDESEYEKASEELLVMYNDSVGSIDVSILAVVMLIILTACVYTFNNRCSLYHESIRLVKENK